MLIISPDSNYKKSLPDFVLLIYTLIPPSNERIQKEIELELTHLNLKCF